MKIALAVLIIGFLAASFTSCTISARQSDRELEQIKQNITYFKDNYDICYAALGSVSNGSLAVVSITAVPCEKVGL